MSKAVAGDIVSIAGFQSATVSHTLNEMSKNVIIPVSFYLSTLIDNNQ